MKTKNLTLAALTAALCCVISPIAIPVGAVPFSLSLFAVYLAAAVSGPLTGTAAVGLYIVLGAVGLPVFSGFMGGAAHLAGPTGGFIIGYLPCALVTGLLAGGKNCPRWRYPAGMTLGSLCCYAAGTLWYCLLTKSTLWAALSVCVLPFVIFDVIKIAAASLLCPRLKEAISRLPSR